jgi:hypothetical protein
MRKVLFVVSFAMMPFLDVTSGAAQRSPRLSDLKFDLNPLIAELDKRHSAEACSQPRPRRIGCTTLCKPCVVWVCKAGEWQRLTLPASPGCPGGSATGPACPLIPSPLIPGHGTCPSGCSVCVNVGSLAD